MSNGDGQHGREELKTVPPPEGAEDAYSAKTRIAPLPDRVLDALREFDAEQERLDHVQSGTRLATAVPSPTDADSLPAPDGASPDGPLDVVEQEAESPLLERVLLVVAVLAVLGALAFVGAMLLAH